jgi:hypothetical protein
MTVNERLFASGRIAAFDAAINKGDRATAIAILRSVDISTPESTVDTIFADPERYGYPR